MCKTLWTEFPLLKLIFSVNNTEEDITETDLCHLNASVSDTIIWAAIQQTFHFSKKISEQKFHILAINE